MKKFHVAIPITGAMSCTVEAVSPTDALERAWALFHEKGPEPFEIEWEAVSQVSEGNVSHAFLNEAYAEKALEAI